MPSPLGRIVYLHQYYKPPSGVGGIRSHELAKRLAAAGYDVHIVTSDVSSRRFRGWRKDQIDGFTVHRLSVPYSNRMSYYKRVLAFIRFAIRAGTHARTLSGSLVFATSTPLTVIIPALVARQFRRIPLVFEVRDLWPELPIAIGALSNPLLKFAARALERLAYRSSTQIVALSPGMKDGVLATGIDENIVTVIPNAADIELFSATEHCPNPWLDSHPEIQGREVVVYCGTLGKINGVTYLAEVAARSLGKFPEIAFVVVGDGAERELIIDRAEALGVLGENFFVMDPVPKSSVPDVFAAAVASVSLFLPLPEMEANSANKFFDGLAAGKPVIVNYGGWQKELLEEHDAGIAIDSEDFDSAADAIGGLVRDKRRISAVGMNARGLAESRFSRDRAADLLLSVFERALHK